MGAEHKHAAFAREDVEDARRGRPDFDLRDYAAARELEFAGDGSPPNFAITGPQWPEYTTNAMTGALPGGEPVMLAHELYEVEVSTGESGPATRRRSAPPTRASKSRPAQPWPGPSGLPPLRP